MSSKSERKNILLNIVNGSSVKLAEQLGSAKLVIPWLLSSLGAPLYLVSLILPIRQSATLIPQLMVSGLIRNFEIRKWFWVISSFVQVIPLILMIWSAQTLTAITASYCIILLMLFFSLSRGVGSVTFQDVIGKVIPKGKRGKIFAHRAAIGGLLAIFCGYFVKEFFNGSASISGTFYLLIGSAILWGIAARHPRAGPRPLHQTHMPI